jgi:hypothetical protein
VVIPVYASGQASAEAAAAAEVSISGADAKELAAVAGAAAAAIAAYADVDAVRAAFKALVNARVKVLATARERALVRHMRFKSRKCTCT